MFEHFYESFNFTNKTIEGYDFKPDAKEGTKDFSNNIMALQEKSDRLNQGDNVIYNNYNKISNSIQEHNSDYDLTYNPNYGNYNKKYREIEIPDKTDLVKTTRDVRERDIQNMMLQQNYIYMVGSITCATLLIAAIIIGRE